MNARTGMNPCSQVLRGMTGSLLFALLAACSPEEPALATDPARTEDDQAPASAILFRDVTEAAGIDFTHVHGGTGRKYLPEIMGSGGAIFDYDGDGWMDVYLVQAGAIPGGDYRGPRVTNRLYHNRGGEADGGLRFEDATQGSGTGEAGYGMGAVAGDYDGDGDPDLYVVNFGPDVLLRNDGGGSFTDTTLEAGIESSLWGSSATFFDPDLDGDLDLYVVNYLDFTVEQHVDCGRASKGVLSYCHPDVYEMAPDIFFLNRGDGSFEEATDAAGLVDLTGKGLGVVAADFTGNGWPDLYVANDSTPNFLFRNRGSGAKGRVTFEEVGLELGVGYNDEGLTEAGMGISTGDVDADGDLDLFVTNLSNETNALYLGGPDFFTYATREAGLFASSYLHVGFGTEFADFDHDGDLDLLVANGHVIDNIELIDHAQTFRQPSQVFFNDGKGNFRLAESATDLSVPRVGRGTLTADFDNDGRLEVLITFNNDRARLFSNELVEVGHWIGLELEGTAGNRGGVGALVTVKAGGRCGVDVKTAGSSYQTSSDPRLHFGLGEAQTVDRVTVAWPGRETRFFEGLAAGRYHKLREGEGSLDPTGDGSSLHGLIGQECGRDGPG